MATSKSKLESVNVRVPPHIKAALQIAAKREMRSQRNMFEVMVLEHWRASGAPLGEEVSKDM